jgi:hypothetical protein
VVDIYNAAENGELPDFDTTVCLPFLSSEKIKELFRELTKNNQAEDSEDYDD